MIFLPAHPASFAHKFVSGMQGFISASLISHEKIVLWTHKFAVGLISVVPMIDYN